MGQGTEYEIEESYDFDSLKHYGYEGPSEYVTGLMDQYEENKAAKIGSVITCPVCSKRFVKRTKDHTFCSNGRQKKGGNCKDTYWNTVDEGRRERAKLYKRV